MLEEDWESNAMPKCPALNKRHTARTRLIDQDDGRTNHVTFTSNLK